MESCYTYQNIVHLRPDYRRMLNVVLRTLNDRACVVYGGAVRDLICGIAPRDIDAHIVHDEPGSVAAVIVKALISAGYACEIMKTTVEYGGIQFQIAVDTSRTIITSCPGIVIDLNITPETKMFTGGYDVNMLYIDNIVDDYDPHCAYAANDDIIAAPWLVARVQDGAISAEKVLNAINSRTATFIGCSVMSMELRMRRMLKLRRAKFVDGTRFTCDRVGCGAASRKTTLTNAKHLIECDILVNERLFESMVMNTCTEAFQQAAKIAYDFPPEDRANRCVALCGKTIRAPIIKVVAIDMCKMNNMPMVELLAHILDLREAFSRLAVSSISRATALNDDARARVNNAIYNGINAVTT